MNTNPKIHLVEIPIGGSDGLLWNRLHEEREDVCEAMLKDSVSLSGAPPTYSTAPNRQSLLQGRLRELDDALDRLMSGSYGHCSRCGGWIGDAVLESNAAEGLCRDCSELQQRRARGN
jgi:hypothetical protein